MAVADKKVFTQVDARLNQVFGSGAKGSLIMLACVLVISTLLRLLFIEQRSQVTKTSGKQLPLVDYLDSWHNSLINLATTQTTEESSLTCTTVVNFMVRTIAYVTLIIPSLLLLLEQLNPRASFKLRLIHLTAICFTCSPFVQMQQEPLLIGTACLLMSICLLVHEWPLFACITFTLAFNLELSYLLLIPAFLVYAVASIIRNSPRDQIVKQVDYIVWRVIFLLLNLMLVNFAIWYPFIVTQSDGEADSSNQSFKLSQLDFKLAKHLLFTDLLPMDIQYSGGLTLLQQLVIIVTCSLPATYLLSMKPNMQQLLRTILLTVTVTSIVGFKTSHTNCLHTLVMTALLLSPDLTPFITATTLMVNVLLFKQGSLLLSQYCIAQAVVILFGGLYEQLVLSDFYMKEKHGRSAVFFFLGNQLEEPQFRKGVTLMSKLIRKCRNMLCIYALSTVFILEPAFGSYVVTAFVNIFFAVVLIGYTGCQMVEETRQTSNLNSQKNQTTIPKKATQPMKTAKAQNKLDISKLFAAKVKEYNQKPQSKNQTSLLRWNGKED